MGLPSGQDVAKRMGADPLDGDDPLWIYILREAMQLGNNGEQLGPIGSRIVGEVFVGLLSGDPQSYYRLNPGWTPELPSAGNNFELRDFLIHAGVL